MPTDKITTSKLELTDVSPALTSAYSVYRLDPMTDDFRATLDLRHALKGENAEIGAVVYSGGDLLLFCSSPAEPSKRFDALGNRYRAESVRFDELAETERIRLLATYALDGFLPYYEFYDVRSGTKEEKKNEKRYFKFDVDAEGILTCKATTFSCRSFLLKKAKTAKERRKIKKAPTYTVDHLDRLVYAPSYEEHEDDKLWCNRSWQYKNMSRRAKSAFYAFNKSADLSKVDNTRLHRLHSLMKRINAGLIDSNGAPLAVIGFSSFPCHRHLKMDYDSLALLPIESLAGEQVNIFCDKDDVNGQLRFTLKHKLKDFCAVLDNPPTFTVSFAYKAKALNVEIVTSEKNRKFTREDLAKPRLQHVLSNKVKTASAAFCGSLLKELAVKRDLATGKALSIALQPALDMRLAKWVRSQSDDQKHLAVLTVGADGSLSYKVCGNDDLEYDISLIEIHDSLWDFSRAEAKMSALSFSYANNIAVLQDTGAIVLPDDLEAMFKTFEKSKKLHDAGLEKKSEAASVHNSNTGTAQRFFSQFAGLWLFSEGERQFYAVNKAANEVRMNISSAAHATHVYEIARYNGEDISETVFDSLFTGVARYKMPSVHPFLLKYLNEAVRLYNPEFHIEEEEQA